MSPLKGLSGLYGPGNRQLDQTMDEGVLRARADPGTGKSHGKYGVQSLGYGGPVPKTSSGYTYRVMDAGDGPSDEYADFGFDEAPYEDKMDKTPSLHGAPWPRGIIQGEYSSVNTPGDLETVALQMQELHGTDFGGPKQLLMHSSAGHEETTRYTTERFDAPNESLLAKVGPQLASAHNTGGAAGSGIQSRGVDPDQEKGKLSNNPEFRAGHSIRRIQHDRMPWDFTNTHGEQDVPFLGRHEVRQKRLDGPDSPYFEAGDISSDALRVWEGRIGYPHAYQQAPEPMTIPAGSGRGIEDVWSW